MHSKFLGILNSILDQKSRIEASVIFSLVEQKRWDDIDLYLNPQDIVLSEDPVAKYTTAMAIELEVLHGLDIRKEILSILKETS